MVTVLHSFLFYLERIVPCRNLKPQTPTVRVYEADDLQVSRHASVCDIIYECSLTRTVWFVVGNEMRDGRFSHFTDVIVTFFHSKTSETQSGLTSSTVFLR